MALVPYFFQMLLSVFRDQLESAVVEKIIAGTSDPEMSRNLARPLMQQSADNPTACTRKHVSGYRGSRGGKGRTRRGPAAQHAATSMQPPRLPPPPPGPVPASARVLPGFVRETGTWVRPGPDRQRQAPPLPERPCPKAGRQQVLPPTAQTQQGGAVAPGPPGLKKTLGRTNPEGLKRLAAKRAEQRRRKETRRARAKKAAEAALEASRGMAGLQPGAQPPPRTEEEEAAVAEAAVAVQAASAAEAAAPSGSSSDSEERDRSCANQTTVQRHGEAAAGSGQPAAQQPRRSGRLATAAAAQATRLGQQAEDGRGRGG